MADAFCHFIDRSLEFSGIPVPEDENIGNSACSFESSCAVDFAVIARHGRDEDSRSCYIDMYVEIRDFLCFFNDRICLIDIFSASWEDRVQCAFVSLEEFVQCDFLAQKLHGISADGTEDLRVRLFCIFSSQFRCRFDNDSAVEVCEILRKRQLAVKGHAEAVAECHLCNRHSDSAVIDSLHGNDMALPDFFIEEISMSLEYVEERHAFSILRLAEENQRVPFLLQFLADSFRSFARSDSEGYECRRNVEVIEGTAHGVLAADSAKTKSHLGMECAQESGSRLAPAVLVRQFFEIFLQREVCLSPVSTHGYKACDGKEDCIDSTMERAPCSKIGIEAVRHEACCIGFTLSDRELGNHAVGRCLLVLAAKRHQDGSSSDSGVKTFRKALLRAVVEVLHAFKPGFPDGFDLRHAEEAFVCRFLDISFFDLLSAVRIEEGSGNVDDRIASPLHDKSLRIGDISNNGSFEIFFCCELDELLSVFASDDDSHSFLGFGNSKLCSVKAFILLRYLVEIDIKAVSQFAYSDGYAACAEIVAAFDEARNFAASEEALDLFFSQRIALLYFCAAGFNGFGIEFL